MFERPNAGERAILVHQGVSAGVEELYELEELAKSAGAQSVYTLHSSRQRPDSKYFIGTGKLEELKREITTRNAEIVLVNHSLTPSQERNLEQALGIRVVDRNGLILDIFAQRARSFEGKLQVELAQLQHLSTRLVRGWQHLERQKGGIGLRGPGETQLETDRRLIGLRIKKIRQRLQRVETQRLQGRRKRKKTEVPSVSIVGYTNAGKSTLFNRMTRAESYAADQLFATLDPTLRHYRLDNGGEAVLADTVGFIRHLPHELVAAFKSTLQEAAEADLLVHVVDASADDRDEKQYHVNEVLRQIDAAQIRQLVVFNKIDQLDGVAPHIDYDDEGKPCRVWVSSLTGVGCDLLDQALSALLSDNRVRRLCFLAPAQANIRSRLFDFARILKEEVNEKGEWEMSVEIDTKYLGILKNVRIEELC